MITTTLSPATELARFNMVERQIRPWNVLDQDVLALLHQMNRADYIPEAHKNQAFSDCEIPLGWGAFMLSPKVEARLLQDLQLTGVESVLEIGTGSGYMAALLGRVAKKVTSYEIVPELAALAQKQLSHAGLRNVTVIAEDASIASAIAGDYDAIVLSGSVAEIPAWLTAKLKLGGRLAAIVGEEPIMRMTLVTRTKDGLQTKEPWDTVAPRLIGFPKRNTFHF